MKRDECFHFEVFKVENVKITSESLVLDKEKVVLVDLPKEQALILTSKSFCEVRKFEVHVHEKIAHEDF